MSNLQLVHTSTESTSYGPGDNPGRVPFTASYSVHV